MTLPVWQGLAAQESSGDIVVLASPSVTVTDRTTGGQPNLFSDRAGNTGIGNPFTADADGSIEFYVAPGRYKVEATKSGKTVTWDDQLIGTLHGIDQPAAGEFPEYDAGNDRWVARQAGYLDPEHATDSGTDAYVSATNTTPPADGVKITRDFQSANTTTTPTLDGKTMTTRDGSALWAGAVSGPHDLQYASGTDTYLVLEPNDERVAQTNTLATLQALPAGVYRTIYMRGRASVGDGGEGHFRWDSSNLSTEVGNDEVTASQGDGGIYIAPASDKTGASGAWVRQIEPNTFYFLHYGGDDNPTKAIQAINVSASDRDTVIFPSGAFTFTSVDNLSTVLNIRGAGWDQTTLIFNSVADGAKIFDWTKTSSTWQEAAGVSIKDITMRSTDSNPVVFDWDWIPKSIMENVRFYGVKNGLVATSCWSNRYIGLQRSSLSGNMIILQDDCQNTNFIGGNIGGNGGATEGAGVAIRGTQYAINFYGVDFEGFSGTTPNAILLQPTSTGLISGVGFWGCYAELGGARLIRLDVTNGTIENVQWNGGRIDGGTSTDFVALVTGGSAVHNIHITRSKIQRLTGTNGVCRITVAPDGIVKISENEIDSSITIWPEKTDAEEKLIEENNSHGRKIISSDAVPAVGTWEVGDVAYNTAPSAGGNIGWVCTSAGTPGTWKTFGDIAA